MTELMNGIKCWDDVMKILDTVGQETVTLMYCMMTDYTAARCGWSTKELLSNLLPIIKKVNSELGDMQLIS